MISRINSGVKSPKKRNACCITHMITCHAIMKAAAGVSKKHGSSNVFCMTFDTTKYTMIGTNQHKLKQMQDRCRIRCSVT